MGSAVEQPPMTTLANSDLGTSELRARAIAFYLPQYHPIPENDSFWGKGFTEWTNVTKARPLFRGHRQPHLPGELGFYDLRLPEVRNAQAELARNAGIEAFCYWHYWFGNGKRALDRIFNEVLTSGEPGFPFCLGWANESWTGRWHGLHSEIIFEQSYSPKDDQEKHLDFLAKSMNDWRYVRVNERPLLLIYRPRELPAGFTEFMKVGLARRGIKDAFLVATDCDGVDLIATGFDAYVRHAPLLGQIPRRSPTYIYRRVLGKAKRVLLPIVHRHADYYQCDRVHYDDYAAFIERLPLNVNELPLVVPNWDNTPRSGHRGGILEHASPDRYGRHFDAMLEKIADRECCSRIVFVKSWNEWAEGNHIEPDAVHGREWLRQTLRCLKGARSACS